MNARETIICEYLKRQGFDIPDAEVLAKMEEALDNHLDYALPGVLDDYITDLESEEEEEDL